MNCNGYDDDDNDDDDYHHYPAPMFSNTTQSSI